MAKHNMGPSRVNHGLSQCTKCHATDREIAFALGLNCSVEDPEPVKSNVEPLRKHVPEDLPEHLRWKGEGPAPASWYAEDGTKVYRSYADYCDD